MRNPYESLAVPRTATADDIKRSFRQLAKKLHPDTNKNDPEAAALFAELNAAHEVLGDEVKRRAFDRGKIDAEGKPRRQVVATRSRRYSTGRLATCSIVAALMLAPTSALVIGWLTPPGKMSASSDRQPERGAHDDTSASKAIATSTPTTRDAIDSAAEPKLDHEKIGVLLARSRRLMSEGDVEAARTMLERAAKSPDPRAALALGSTYDPMMLAILQARGVASDVFLARIWYRRASALGSQEAKERLDLLAHLGGGEPIPRPRAGIPPSIASLTAARNAAAAAGSAKPKRRIVRPPTDVWTAPDDPYGIYVSGVWVGEDPDPNIRAQVMRDDAARQLRNVAGRGIFTSPPRTTPIARLCRDRRCL